MKKSVDERQDNGEPESRPETGDIKVWYEVGAEQNKNSVDDQRENAEG